ncbi:MAG: hypothetical protein J5978_07145 [Spirochaetaceae bacterium]|nr:hypothetical protein [Spirochaetaceae bacterium]
MKNLQKIIVCLLVLSALFVFGCDQGGSNNFSSERQIKVIYDESIMTVYEQGDTDSSIVPSGGTVGSWSNPMVVIKLDSATTYDKITYNGKDFKTVDEYGESNFRVYREYNEETSQYVFAGYIIYIGMYNMTESKKIDDKLEIEVTTRPAELITINFENLHLYELSTKYDKEEGEMSSPESSVQFYENTLLQFTDDLEDPENNVVDYYEINNERFLVYRGEEGMVDGTTSDFPEYVHKSFAVDGAITYEAIPRAAKNIKINFDEEKIACSYENPYDEEDKWTSFNSGDEIKETMRVKAESKEVLPEEKLWEGTRFVGLAEGFMFYSDNTLTHALEFANLDVTEFTLEAVIRTLPTYIITFDGATCNRCNEETGEYTTTISSGKALIERVELSFDAQERERYIFKCWSVNGEEDPYIGRDKINGFEYWVNPSDAISNIIRIEPVYIPVEEYTIELGTNVNKVNIYYIDDTSEHLTEKTVIRSSEKIETVIFGYDWPEGCGYDKYLLNGIKVDDPVFDVYELYEYADENNVIRFDAMAKER